MPYLGSRVGGCVHRTLLCELDPFLGNPLKAIHEGVLRKVALTNTEGIFLLVRVVAQEAFAIFQRLDSP